MFRYFSCLMLATAVVGAVLSIIASGTLLLALGLMMLMIGAGGLSAAWMSYAAEVRPAIPALGHEKQAG
ncbi:hypothetical protein [Arthrobacter sp. MI7-26]|uniref:hypothetical protein n=1 Tax=Arthrobacter sp. MI7-26 TaxID=2993653 RepID=UPI0022489ACD|nr:hypothetical protein [Arthrobacter sp. MI7-26]